MLVGSSINHNDVVDFACTREATWVIMQKKVEPLPSIIPDKADYRGLVHFYKQGGQWRFIEEDDLEMEHGRLPDICFATRHPIKDWDRVSKEILPDLDELQKNADRSKKNARFRDVKTTLKNEDVEGQSLYYSQYKINGQ